MAGIGVEETYFEIENKEDLKYPFVATKQFASLHAEDQSIWPFLLQTDQYSHYLQRLAENSRGGACSEQWNADSIAVKCHDCESDSTCAMCVECFFKSNHEGHMYQFIRTSGGCCDCGDLSSWAAEGCCPDHGGMTQAQYAKAAEEQLTELEKEAPGFRQRAELAYSKISDYFWEILEAVAERRSPRFPESLLERPCSDIMTPSDMMGAIRRISEWLTATVGQSFATRRLVEQYFFTNIRIDQAVLRHKDLPNAAQDCLQKLYLSMVGFPIFKRAFGVAMGTLFLAMHGARDPENDREPTGPNPYESSDRGLLALSVQVFTVSDVACDLCESGALGNLLQDVVTQKLALINKSSASQGSFIFALLVSLRYILRATPPIKLLTYLNGPLKPLLAYLSQHHLGDIQTRATLAHVPYENKLGYDFFALSRHFHKGMVKFYDWVRLPLAGGKFLYGGDRPSLFGNGTKDEFVTPPSSPREVATVSPKVLGEGEFRALLELCRTTLSHALAVHKFLTKDELSFHMDPFRLVAQCTHYEATFEVFQGALQHISGEHTGDTKAASALAMEVLSVFRPVVMLSSLTKLLTLLCRSGEIRDGFWVRNGGSVVTQNLLYTQQSCRIDIMYTLWCMVCLRMSSLLSFNPSSSEGEKTIEETPIFLKVVMDTYLHLPPLDSEVSEAEVPAIYAEFPELDLETMQYHQRAMEGAFGPGRDIGTLIQISDHIKADAPLTGLTNMWFYLASLVSLGMWTMEKCSVSREHLGSKGCRTSGSLRPTVPATSEYSRRTESLLVLELARGLALLNRVSFSTLEQRIPPEWKSHPMMNSLLGQIATRNSGANGTTFSLRESAWDLPDLLTLDLNHVELSEAEENVLKASNASLVGPSWPRLKELISDEHKAKLLFVLRLLSENGILFGLIVSALDGCLAYVRHSEEKLSAMTNSSDAKDAVVLEESTRERIIGFALKVLCDTILPLWWEGPSPFISKSIGLDDFLHSDTERQARAVRSRIERLTEQQLEPFTQRIVAVAARRLDTLAKSKGWWATDVSRASEDSVLIPSPTSIPDKGRAQQDALMAEIKKKQSELLAQLMAEGRDLLDDEDDLMEGTETLGRTVSGEDGVGFGLSEAFEKALQPLNGRLDCVIRRAEAETKENVSEEIAAKLEMYDFRRTKCAICHEGPNDTNFLGMMAFCSDANLLRRHYTVLLTAPNRDDLPKITSCASGGGSMAAVPYTAPSFAVCGHIVHLVCLAKHCRENRRNRGNPVQMKPQAGEFSCPMCRALSNCVVPYLPISTLLFKTAHSDDNSAGELERLARLLLWDSSVPNLPTAPDSLAPQSIRPSEPWVWSPNGTKSVPLTGGIGLLSGDLTQEYFEWHDAGYTYRVSPRFRNQGTIVNVDSISLGNRPRETTQEGARRLPGRGDVSWMLSLAARDQRVQDEFPNPAQGGEENEFLASWRRTLIEVVRETLLPGLPELGNDHLTFHWELSPNGAATITVLRTRGREADERAPQAVANEDIADQLTPFPNDTDSIPPATPVAETVVPGNRPNQREHIPTPYPHHEFTASPTDSLNTGSEAAAGSANDQTDPVALIYEPAPDETPAAPEIMADTPQPTPEDQNAGDGLNIVARIVLHNPGNPIVMYAAARENEVLPTGGAADTDEAGHTAAGGGETGNDAESSSEADSDDEVDSDESVMVDGVQMEEIEMTEVTDYTDEALQQAPEEPARIGMIEAPETPFEFEMTEAAVMAAQEAASRAGALAAQAAIEAAADAVNRVAMGGRAQEAREAEIGRDADDTESAGRDTDAMNEGETPYGHVDRAQEAPTLPRQDEPSGLPTHLPQSVHVTIRHLMRRWIAGWRRYAWPDEVANTVVSERATTAMRAGDSPLFYGCYQELLRVARYKPLTFLQLQSADAPRPIFVSLLRIAMLKAPVRPLVCQLMESSPNLLTSPEVWLHSLHSGEFHEMLCNSPWFVDTKTIWLRIFLASFRGLGPSPPSPPDASPAPETSPAKMTGALPLTDRLWSIMTNLKVVLEILLALTTAQVINTAVMQDLKDLLRSRRTEREKLSHNVLHDFFSIFGLQDHAVLPTGVNASLRPLTAELDWLDWKPLLLRKLAEETPSPEADKLNPGTRKRSASTMLKGDNTLIPKLADGILKYREGVNKENDTLTYQTTIQELQSVCSDWPEAKVLKQLTSYVKSTGVERYERWGATCPKGDFHKGGHIWDSVIQNLERCPQPFDVVAAPEDMRMAAMTSLSEADYWEALWVSIRERTNASDTAFGSCKRFRAVVEPLVASAHVDVLQFAAATLAAVWKFSDLAANRLAYPSEDPLRTRDNLRSALGMVPHTTALQYPYLADVVNLLWSEKILTPTSAMLSRPVLRAPCAFPDGQQISSLLPDTPPKSCHDQVEHLGIGKFLPHAFYDLVRRQYKRKCTECHQTSYEQAVCLNCGSVTCLQSRLVGLGETAKHASRCGNGNGLFLLPYLCFLLHVSADRSNFALMPYVDENGEPDTQLERGRPTFLDIDQLQKAAQVYLDFDSTREIIRTTERTGRYVRQSL